ncbi:BrnT family toxin [Mesorhizobium sp. DCY119]|uniref:BrnT family toxin n=1 Tax=Mesorhizobium sp. DCY119 TaxID=2108445 RepID=UPI000E6D3258|nr:BrnT family toxin [Mesorhizobium sp. DCY119]RJG44370.1 BrnT family toxin [Mesorhizobium sp. DCY119]
MHRIETLEFSGFEWNLGKEQSNIQKHGIDFDEAAIALSQPHIEVRSDRDGEVRTLAICPASGRIIAVIYTMRGEKCRIISARAARKDEQRAYRHYFP